MTLVCNILNRCTGEPFNVKAAMTVKTLILNSDKSVFEIFGNIAAAYPNSVLRVIKPFKLLRFARFGIRCVNERCQVKPEIVHVNQVRFFNVPEQRAGNKPHNRNSAYKKGKENYQQRFEEYVHRFFCPFSFLAHMYPLLVCTWQNNKFNHIKL